MEWAEVSFKTSREAVEAISSAFTEVGASGVVIDDPALVNEYIRSGLWDYTDIKENADTNAVTITAYLENDGAFDEKIEKFREEARNISRRGTNIAPAEFSVRKVEDEDWAESWKKYFHAKKAGSRVVVRPSWEAYSPGEGEIVIALDPGAAFGTGDHPTTAMCVRELEKLVRPGITVFDVGTGSGILAITAAKLGAKKVFAADFDGTALKVASENIAANDVSEQIELFRSDLFSGFLGKADVITANLIADLVIRLFDALDEYLAPGGTLLASGIIDDRTGDVRRAAEKHGYVVHDEKSEREWRAMLIRRSGK